MIKRSSAPAEWPCRAQQEQAGVGARVVLRSLQRRDSKRQPIRSGFPFQSPPVEHERKHGVSDSDARH